MTTRLLLVEDDAISQDLICALCEAHGLSVDVAADGFRGLKLLSEGRHAVVLIDYHLPEMDGYALARLMRELSVGRSGDLKLVGVTADRDGLAQRRGADALFDAILHKPIDPSQLFATLDRLLEPSDPSDAALVRAKAFLAEPDAGRAVAAADAFWRRRGLDGRPRAVACPAPTPDQAAALGLCFTLTPQAQDADLVLILEPAGIEVLRTLRTDPTTSLIPAVDLTGQLGRSCEAAYRIDDPDTWTAVARCLRDVATRRDRLAAASLRPTDVSLRLLAQLFVAGGLVLRETEDASVAASLETGLDPRGLIAVLADLNERDLVTCTPGSRTIEVALSEQGLHLLTSAQERPTTTLSARTADATLRARVAALFGSAPTPSEDLWSSLARSLARPRDETTDHVAERAADTAVEEPASAASEGSVVHTLGIEEGAPILNRRKIEELDALIGPDNVASLRGRLTEQLRAAFRDAGRPAEMLAQESHILISVSGMLGCDRLSWACSRLEHAANAGGNIDAALAIARAMRDQTLALLTEQD